MINCQKDYKESTGLRLSMKLPSQKESKNDFDFKSFLQSKTDLIKKWISNNNDSYYLLRNKFWFELALSPFIKNTDFQYYKGENDAEADDNDEDDDYDNEDDDYYTEEDNDFIAIKYCNKRYALSVTTLSYILDIYGYELAAMFPIKIEINDHII